MVTIVGPELKYLGDLQRQASDLRVSVTTNVPHPYPSDGAIAWMARVQRMMSEKKNRVFMVLSDDLFCGLMSLNTIDWEHGRAELDYWIGPDYQGRGIGTEAMGLVIERARQELGLRVLFSSCLASNPASARILEKNGFGSMGHFLNDGTFGEKFLNKEMIRFRKDLVAKAKGTLDRYDLHFINPL